MIIHIGQVRAENIGQRDDNHQLIAGKILPRAQNPFPKTFITVHIGPTASPSVLIPTNSQLIAPTTIIIHSANLGFSSTRLVVFSIIGVI